MLKKCRLYFDISLISAVSVGIPLLFIPLVSTDTSGRQVLPEILIAGMFWLSLTVEILFLIFTSVQVKRIEAFLIDRQKKSFQKMPYGIISFFRCKEAGIADVAMILSSGLLIASFVVRTNEWLFICGIVSFILFFQFHCFLNGRSYQYIKEYKKYKKKQGEKKNA